MGKIKPYAFQKKFNFASSIKDYVYGGMDNSVVVTKDFAILDILIRYICHCESLDVEGVVVPANCAIMNLKNV